MKNCFFHALLFIFSVGHSQTEKDSISLYRKPLVATAISVGFGGSIGGLSTVWYDAQSTGSFHFFDDGKDWLQMDKLGHVYTGIFVADMVEKSLVWAQVPRKKAILFGSLTSFLYLNSFEILDGYGKDYGFSAWDVFSNALGAGLFATQKLLSDQSTIRLKWSFHLSPYAQFNPNVLGQTNLERVFKDYNGQTYWLTASPYSIPKFEFWPKWLGLSLGYGIDNKIFGTPNIAQVGSTSFEAKRQYYLSLDLLPERFTFKKKWVKYCLAPLNWIKLPFPSLQLSAGKLTFLPLHF